MQTEDYKKVKKNKLKFYKKLKLKLISIEENIFQHGLEKTNNHFINLMINNNIKTSIFSTCVEKINSFKRGNENEITTEIFKEMKQYAVINDLKDMLTAKEWNEKGYSKHITYIYNRHMTLNEVAIKLGLNIVIKSNGYWKKFENLEKEILPIIKENGSIWPTITHLRNIGRGDLDCAIYKYWNGNIECAKLFGFESFGCRGHIQFRKIEGWINHSKETVVI
jgi:hypothetical protein